MARADAQSSLERDLPDYRIDTVLGSGSTSTVYRATQKTLGRYVAIKRFAPEAFLAESVVRKRFEREAAMWGHFSHENLIHLYDYRSTDNARYIILEYCHGIELRELMSQVVTLPTTVAACIIHQALSALDYLHRYGIVHRDVKPANLFVTSYGVVKLMDFGISLCPELEPMTAPGQILGTPAYMSPEQALGRSVDPRADLFSLAVVLYEMLEGVKPFRATDLEGVLEEIRTGNYVRLSRKHPSSIRNLIHSSLHRTPAKRPASAAKAKEVIERYLRKERVQMPREVIQKFLLDRGAIRDLPSLFPDGVVEETARSPLAQTFAALAQEPQRSRTVRWRPWLFGTLAISLLAAAYFGPWEIRPDWSTLGEILGRWISQIFGWLSRA